MAELKFSETTFLTKDGKKVYSQGGYKTVLDEVKDKSNRIWNLVQTVWDGKTTKRWVAEDAESRFSMDGEMKVADIKKLNGSLITTKGSVLTQSEEIEHEPESV